MYKALLVSDRKKKSLPSKRVYFYGEIDNTANEHVH